MTEKPDPYAVTPGEIVFRVCWVVYMVLLFGVVACLP